MLLAGCDRITNSPHASGAEKTNTFFTAFQERSPKYLDPTASYSLDETPYTYAIYEPLYRFHYLKRPYEVAPRAAEAVATPRYYDKDGRELPADAPGDQIAESVYDIRLRKGILYAPHPAFAKDEAGNLRYHALTPEELGDKRTPFDFEHRGTRELTAHDYVYGIKRLATTRIKSPSFSPMAEHIKGLKDYGELISKEDEKLRNGKPLTDRNLPFLDFRQFPLAGVEAIDDHTLRIRLDGKYPQFKYWLTMSFFSPVPWEVDKLLRAARHGGAQPQHELLAGRHRPVHADRVPGKPPARAFAQPELPRRALSLRGRSSGQGGRPARRLRQADALHRPGGLLDREGTHSAQDQVHAGLLRQPGDLALRLAARHGLRRQELGEGRAALPRARHPDAEDARDLQLVPRLQLVGSCRRQGQDARGTGAQPQAAPGAVDRDRLGRVRSRLREQGGRRAGHERRAAGSLFVPAGGDQPHRVRHRRRQAARASRSRRRSGCWPRPATPTAETRRPGSRWCSTTTTSAR